MILINKNKININSITIKFDTIDNNNQLEKKKTIFLKNILFYLIDYLFNYVYECKLLKNLII